MEIRRYRHACVGVEVDGVRLVIDPGEFGVPEDLAQADAILVTHDHFDHISHDALDDAVAQNPEIAIYGPAALEKSASVPVHVVRDGDVFAVKGVTVEVTGHWQAVTSLYDPPIENVGYLTAETLLHPGDAFPTKPGVPAVFLPLAAPWSKHADIERYLMDYRPKHVFPYHDLNLNETGLTFGQKSMAEAAEAVGAVFHPMREGERFVWKSE